MCKGKHHALEQIASILKQQRRPDDCRKLPAARINQQALYRPKSKYGRMGTTKVNRLKRRDDDEARNGLIHARYRSGADDRRGKFL